jgi:putative membrane protein
MVGQLSDADREQLAQAVAEAERRTSAEVVLAVAEASDDYDVYSHLAAAIAGFLVAGVLAVLYPDLPIRIAFMIVAAAVLLSAVLFTWAPLRLRIVPGAVQRAAVARLARAEFAARVAGQTRAANGVLIFISLAEHGVEILPERGIAAAVPEAKWHEVVDALVTEVRSGALVRGIVRATIATADILATVFPPHQNDQNEIGDAVVSARHP